MIARESDLAMLAARCLPDRCVSSLHAGENSPSFAMKLGLDVSSRVPKVTSAAYDRSVYLSERDGRRCPDLRHVEVRDQAFGALAGVARLVRGHLPVELLELRLPLVAQRHLHSGAKNHHRYNQLIDTAAVLCEWGWWDMNYSEVKYFDIANGEGVCTSLFVSGCRHGCPGCFNPEQWDFTAGKPFSP